MGRLEQIGFYTLSDDRARQASVGSPLWRCELLLTDRCNFACTYCRGIVNEHAKGDIGHAAANDVIRQWCDEGLRHVRFSGGEPTLWPGLPELVSYCRYRGVQRIAVSTNGSASRGLYQQLLALGVDDVSVSLDSGCCAVAESITGRAKSWQTVVDNIRFLAERTYVTVGMVFTEANVDSCIDDVLFVDSLGISDIRVIPAAQYNQALTRLAELPGHVLLKYPILRYRIRNIRAGRHVRGLRPGDCGKCWLALDDMACAQGWHFPCIIHLREGGDPIGRVGPTMRQDRAAWIAEHDSFADPICRANCLDVCVDYNNRAAVGRNAKD
jgi:MoaA/NifB/PqqE/SkfB family radical SAM enzyme